MGCFIHHSSVVDEGASLGNGTRVWHFSHVSSGAKIGADVTIGQNVFIGSKVTIGEKCKIQNNVALTTTLLCNAGFSADLA